MMLIHQDTRACMYTHVHAAWAADGGIGRLESGTEDDQKQCRICFTGMASHACAPATPLSVPATIAILLPVGESQKY